MRRLKHIAVFSSCVAEVLFAAVRRSVHTAWPPSTAAMCGQPNRTLRNMSVAEVLHTRNKGEAWHVWETEQDVCVYVWKSLCESPYHLACFPNIQHFETKPTVKFAVLTKHVQTLCVFSAIYVVPGAVGGINSIGNTARQLPFQNAANSVTCPRGALTLRGDHLWYVVVGQHLGCLFWGLTPCCSRFVSFKRLLGCSLYRTPVFCPTIISE